ncbi:hypothetical protein D7D52_13975 [Nocardia yunnanensis]|uniref:Secreted protein n=1 Tax=Nocardia yunnanensis TaxID=2382165 RepID=A0A386ZB33_9NOCA|nr:hypothetical protein [Nocardia yunnanensis]AYF74788.1 hypothetical protein D7D52_13975 [Nocardia yunnanensis]
MNSKKIVGAFAVAAALCMPAAVLAVPAQATPDSTVQPVDSGTDSGSGALGPRSGSAYQSLNKLVCLLFHTSLDGSVGVPIC